MLEVRIKPQKIYYFGRQWDWYPLLDVSQSTESISGRQKEVSKSFIAACTPIEWVLHTLYSSISVSLRQFLIIKPRLSFQFLRYSVHSFPSIRNFIETTIHLLISKAIRVPNLFKFRKKSKLPICHAEDGSMKLAVSMKTLSFILKPFQTALIS